MRCADAASAERMVAAIDDGAQRRRHARRRRRRARRAACRSGLGSHVQWDRKIDGRLAQALMSIHSVKGVEIGGGFGLTRMTGSQVHDVILPREQWTDAPVGARDEQRRRHRGRHHRRPGHRRPRRAEADRDAAALAAVGRPAHRRGDPRALRAQRRLRRAGGRRHRRGDVRDRARARRRSRSSAATRCARRCATGARSRRRPARATCARDNHVRSDLADRLHGHRKVPHRAAARRGARPRAHRLAAPERDRDRGRDRPGRALGRAAPTSATSRPRPPPCRP